PRTGATDHPRVRGEHTCLPAGSKIHISVFVHYARTIRLHRAPAATESPTPGRLTPTRRHGWICGRVAGATHKGYAIHVDRFPVMVVHFERKPLLATCLKNHQGTTRAGHFEHPKPQAAADPSTYMPNVDAGGDLQQPLGEVTAEPGRAGGKDDDGHQKSTSSMSA